ncbi:MAG: hypothetical protein AB7T27_08245 [Kiritimatiellia bacterium]
MAQVTIPQLAELLGGLPPLKNGLQKSPFRDDQKGKSFSLFDGGRRFKDHARPEDAGGCWHFVKLACPAWGKKEIAEFIIRAAGLDPTKDKPNRAAWKRFKGDMHKAMYAERARAVAAWTKPEPLPGWADPVRAAYKEGWLFLKRSEEKQRRIARDRGWPVSVVTSLLDAGLISYPWLPWARPGAEGARRGVAFRVDQPEAAAPGGHGSRRMKLQPIGYHQRFHTPEGKQWVFVPYVPPGKPFSDFQQTLKTLQQKIQPLPFVLGDLARPRGLVILEGQWDAITFFHAYGGFIASGNPLGLAVFGIRGVNGREVFLSHYGPLLKSSRPPVLLVADNDTAGKSWIEPPQPDPLKLPPPSFVERLQGLGALRVVTQFLKDSSGLGKDFNDYYKARQPGPDGVAAWLAGLGFPEARDNEQGRKNVEEAETVANKLFAEP